MPEITWNMPNGEQKPKSKGNLTMTLYEKFKEHRVPAASVEDFRQRYTKPSHFQKRGPEYVAAVLQSALEDMERYGYTITPRHSSVTGEVVVYYGDD